MNHYVIILFLPLFGIPLTSNASNACAEKDFFQISAEATSYNMNNHSTKKSGETTETTAHIVAFDNFQRLPDGKEAVAKTKKIILSKLGDHPTVDKFNHYAASIYFGKIIKMEMIGTEFPLLKVTTSKNCGVLFNLQFSMNGDKNGKWMQEFSSLLKNDFPVLEGKSSAEAPQLTILLTPHHWIEPAHTSPDGNVDIKDEYINTMFSAGNLKVEGSSVAKSN